MAENQPPKVPYGSYREWEITKDAIKKDMCRVSCLLIACVPFPIVNCFFAGPFYWFCIKPTTEEAVDVRHVYTSDDAVILYQGTRYTACKWHCCRGDPEERSVPFSGIQSVQTRKPDKCCCMRRYAGTTTVTFVGTGAFQNARSKMVLDGLQDVDGFEQLCKDKTGRDDVITKQPV